MIGPDVYSFRALWRQSRNCCRNKRNTLNALAFEIDAEAKLLELQGELREHSYRPGPSICFVTGGRKPREVFAADFRDRVVHHLLVAYQERAFEPFFIHDSYACRRGKGTLAASDRLMRFLRQITANGRRPAWALKLDVASFFPSIHKQSLFAIIARRIKDPEILWLTRTILFHDPTTNYRFRSLDRRVGEPGTAGYPVPARKSLFGKANERGLPIGNLTSQFWGNVYLNELDQFVKRTLTCRFYLRYVDDLVLLSEARDELVAWRGEIKRFLRERLRLELRADGQEPFPVRQGIDVVGWKTWWNRRLPRKQTVGNLLQRVDRFERRAVRPVCGGLALRIDLVARTSGRVRPGRSRVQDLTGVERLRATLASYSGHLRHGAAWRQWEGVWASYPWLRLLFERDGWTIADRWRGRRIARACRFRDQYSRLVRHARDDCLVFCHVGRFVEFYGPQRIAAEQVLGLRRAWLPRAGYVLTVGFPERLAIGYKLRALRAGRPVVEVRQGPAELRTGCRPRIPSEVLIPARWLPILVHGPRGKGTHGMKQDLRSFVEEYGKSYVAWASGRAPVPGGPRMGFMFPGRSR